jgi:hypothetical protein
MGLLWWRFILWDWFLFRAWVPDWGNIVKVDLVFLKGLVFDSGRFILRL